MPINYKIIGHQIKTARKHKNYSQALLSELVNLTPGYISYIETGEKCLSLESLVALANILDVTVDILLAENLKNHEDVLANELSEIIADCTAIERRILVENAKALKEILRENRHRPNC